MSFTTSVDYLSRANLWTNELKDINEFDLMAMKYVDVIDFPDGDTLNMPSIGQFEVADYTENAAARYTAADTGNWTFTITEYKQAGVYITRKAKQDLFYAEQLVSSFVPKMSRAIAEDTESFIFSLFNSTQTASNTNAVNGAAHRWVGAGANETISPTDFARAKNSFQMAGAPMTNLVAIVHPSVEYALDTMTNIVNVSNNPRWEGIIETGHRTGLRFSKNIYGFDVYVSQFLPTGQTDTIENRTAAAGAANIFLSANKGMDAAMKFAVRQAPIVDSSFNKDFQRDEYVMTYRYGAKVFRPENYLIVVTDTDQVA
jgi:hypothetical protein